MGWLIYFALSLTNTSLDSTVSNAVSLHLFLTFVLGFHIDYEQLIINSLISIHLLSFCLKKFWIRPRIFNSSSKSHFPFPPLQPIAACSRTLDPNRSSVASESWSPGAFQTKQDRPVLSLLLNQQSLISNHHSASFNLIQHHSASQPMTDDQRLITDDQRVTTYD